MTNSQDGTITVWKAGTQADPFHSGDPLKGHSCAVVSLIIGAGRLYSGSVDGIIRVGVLFVLYFFWLLSFGLDDSDAELCGFSFLKSMLCFLGMILNFHLVLC